MRYPSRIATIGSALLPLALLSACGSAVDAGGAPSEDVAQTAQSIVGSNPLVDVEFFSNLTPVGPNPPSYKDLAVAEGSVFLLRSDGKVEQRTRPAAPPADAPITRVITGPYSAIKGIQGQFGNGPVIAAQDSSRTILKNIEGTPVVLGSYPVLVNNIIGITAVASTQAIFLYVECAGTHGEPVPFLRTGQSRLGTNVIQWSATNQSMGQFETGFAYAPFCSANGSNCDTVFTVTNPPPSIGPNSQFTWFKPPTGISGEAHLAPHTEHAYTNSGGFYDRFAPVGMDFNDADGYFWGIDQSFPQEGTAFFWALTRLNRDNLQP
jgi:hypothetical protein